MLKRFHGYIINAPPQKHHLVKVCVTPKKDLFLPPFTGKVVKTLLIKSNPRLVDIFQKPFIFKIDSTTIVAPKPIRLTPLIYENKYLWKRKDDKKLMAYSGETYCFFIGFKEVIEDEVLNSLYNLDGVEAFDTRWFVEHIVSVYNVTLPSERPLISLRDKNVVKISFDGPVRLIDPFAKSRYARMLPTAGIVFAYNVGDILRTYGKFDKEYMFVISLLNSALKETYKVYKTIDVSWYIYDGKVLPTLTGYVNYIIDWNIITDELRLLMENILSHAIIMGIGSGRAAGFGAVSITVR